MTTQSPLNGNMSTNERPLREFDVVAMRGSCTVKVRVGVPANGRVNSTPRELFSVCFGANIAASIAPPIVGRPYSIARLGNVAATSLFSMCCIGSHDSEAYDVLAAALSALAAGQQVLAAVPVPGLPIVAGVISEIVVRVEVSSLHVSDLLLRELTRHCYSENTNEPCGTAHAFQPDLNPRGSYHGCTRPDTLTHQCLHRQ